MNLEEMVEHAFAHGVLTTLDRHAEGWTVEATDSKSSSVKEAKYGHDALEQALCTVSFKWEDKDMAAAFRTALCHGVEGSGE